MPPALVIRNLSTFMFSVEKKASHFLKSTYKIVKLNISQGSHLFFLMLSNLSHSYSYTVLVQFTLMFCSEKKLEA